jgi:hypothetical protein
MAWDSPDLVDQLLGYTLWMDDVFQGDRYFGPRMWCDLPADVRNEYIRRAVELKQKQTTKKTRGRREQSQGICQNITTTTDADLSHK